MKMLSTPRICRPWHARAWCFRGDPVKVRYMPESKRKGYGFWHLISEAPDQGNRDEDERIPDLRRCERVRWVAWCIQNAHEAGFSWWENERGRETHVVIWAEEHDFAVVLAKRRRNRARVSICSRPRTACGRTRSANSPRSATHGELPKKTEAPAHCCARASDTPSTRGR
jgi:hypothetical protein